MQALDFGTDLFSLQQITNVVLCLFVLDSGGGESIGLVREMDMCGVESLLCACDTTNYQPWASCLQGFASTEPAPLLKVRIYHAVSMCVI